MEAFSLDKKGPGSPSSSATGEAALTITDSDQEEGSVEPPAAEDRVQCLGLDLTDLTKAQQFFAMAAIIILSFLVSGICLERIFSDPALRKESWYTNLVQSGMYATVAGLELEGQGSRRNKGGGVPIRTYMVLGACLVLSFGCANASLQYLNYPTQVVFKSCKLIPVLIGGVLVQGKWFSCVDLLGTVLACAGVSLFVLGDASVSAIVVVEARVVDDPCLIQVSLEFDATGVILLSVSLCADALMGNLQEKVLKKHANTTNSELTFFSYLWCSSYLLSGLALSGNLAKGFLTYAGRPLLSYGLVALLSASGLVGVHAILSFMKRFDVFSVTMVTTSRKVISVLLSFVLFSKPFNIRYLYGGLLLTVGLFLTIRRQRISTKSKFVPKV